MCERARLLCLLFVLCSLDSRHCSASTGDDADDADVGAGGGAGGADGPRIPLNVVQGWSVKLGKELWHFGEFVTRRKEVQDSFKSAQMETRDGKKLVQSMAEDIQAMMQLKISAIRRIVDSAEAAALDSQKDEVPPDYQFYNSKEMEEPWTPEMSTSPAPPTAEPDEGTVQRPPSLDAHLEPNPHYYDIAVNTNFSSVHVPTNVYSWAPQVIKGIHWSEKLDSIFMDNYRKDPTLSWQYFGSSTGFMRHYPALKWVAEPVDIYDCRTRAWYLEAAASPKDMVVLVDRSGSMTGQRRDIAKHVVTNILDTLGNNDFVNVMTFSDTVDDIVPCFHNSLVQATLGNLRELKLGLDNFETTEIANFSAALTRAFELLREYRESDNTRGANCNQAIMLVTDGVPYNYKEIFQRLNWNYSTPVRVFTYLIGREVKVADVREVKWMACANRGFYVHLSTMAEVRERVLEHVNVLARPLVLQREEHPVVWTPVYANVTDPKIADYLWEQRERAEQKERFMSQRRDKTLFNSQREQERRWKLTQMKQGQYSELGNMEYQLMTSVSMPVYDTRDYEVRIANLLGVAGTDVPLQEIHALMTPYKLGVNGYAFIVTNNGYILIHPDLRPVFQGILKPSYNSVDMIEVELMDDDRAPRNFSLELLAMRKHIIDQNTGSERMNVKYHLDDMRRVSRIRRHYFWRGIAESPFTLVVTVPEPYGLHRLTPPPTDDIHRTTLTSKGTAARQYFRMPHKWSVHPDWLYCRHYNRTFASPEEELLYFLERMTKPGWRWPIRPRPPEHHPTAATVDSARSNHTRGEHHTKEQKSNHTKDRFRENYYCDHGLMQALVFDARNTEWFNQNISISTKDDFKEEFIKRFGITVAFLATHSGLTRWQTFPTPTPTEPDNHNSEFGSEWPRAIDEVWYRRAVEQHYIEPNSFVYSVGEEHGEGAEALVTASHAVFHAAEGEHGRKAPAAVVGFQFRHHHLKSLFNNITSTVGDSGECNCRSEELECFLVDNNGWVVVSDDDAHTGQFFGKVRADVMSRLVEEKVFRAVHVVDYQAVCFRETRTTNPARTMLTPLDNLRLLAGWLASNALWLWHSACLTVAHATSYTQDFASYDSYGNEETSDEPYDESAPPEPPSRARERDFDKLVLINRTRPTPCDRELYLYMLLEKNLEEKLNRPMRSCERPFVVQAVPNTNLLLVITDALCPHREPRDAPLMPAASPARPAELEYNSSLPCLKHEQGLYRTLPASCISRHANESMIVMCGRAGRPLPAASALLLLLPHLLSRLH